MEKLDVSIYRITNLINHKIYIGLTCQPVEKRFAQHKYNSTRPNPKAKISKALKKYGIENFLFEKIETANSLDAGLDREVELIHQFQTHIVGYNVLSTKFYTKGTTGQKLSQATKDLMSEVHRKRTPHPNSLKNLIMDKGFSEVARQKAYSKTRTPIVDDRGVVYSSVTEAAEKLGTPKSNISAVLKGRRPSAAGRTFKYVNIDG